MKDLFEMDLKDYNPDGKVYCRPSVRAIIYDEDKVLLVHSRKYDYYNFPGGGIEEGEDHKAALIREVKEETGFDVIESSIEEFGRVPRKQKDSFDEDGIFFQENFYYFCKIEGKQSELKLVGYEEEEGYEPVWVNAMLASRHNLYKQLDVPAIDEGMIKRDGKVLDIADLAIRKRIRYEQETEYIRNPGAVFEDCYDHIMRFTNRIQKENPMVTKAGIRIWDEKTKLVNEFVSHLKADIEF